MPRASEKTKKDSEKRWVECVSCHYKWQTKTKLRYISCPNCRHTSKVVSAVSLYTEEKKEVKEKEKKKVGDALKTVMEKLEAAADPSPDPVPTATTEDPKPSPKLAVTEADDIFSLAMPAKQQLTE